jgi:hypothetical protein
MDNDKPRSGSSDATGGGHDHVADRRKAAPAPHCPKVSRFQFLQGAVMGDAVDFDGDAIRSYACAMERRQAILDTWEELGRPIVTEGSRGQVRPHPLRRMMAEADSLCDKLRRPLQVRHRGPVSMREKTARTIASDKARFPGEPPRVTLNDRRPEPPRRTCLRPIDDAG